jgi:hypothetical protein
VLRMLALGFPGGMIFRPYVSVAFIAGRSSAIWDLLESAGRMNRVVVSSLHYRASRVDSLF